MSSQNQATFETALLLEDSRSAGLSRERFKFSLLIPVAFATNLGALIPSTTLLDLIRHAACGLISLELCNAPEVDRYFATMMAINAATECILTVVLCSITTRISSYYGRKPAFLFILIAGAVGNCLVPGSQYVPNWPANWVFLMGALLRMLSGPIICIYLSNLYIVDICAPEYRYISNVLSLMGLIPSSRTAALSKITGWVTLGGCISYALGGTITTKTGNPLIVFYLAATIFVVTFIYVFSVLPESFSVEKRNALSLKRTEPSTGGLSTQLLHIFEPLKMLIPTRKLDGTRNWRLAYFAAHASLFAAANVYALPAWMILATSKNHLSPAETGLFLTVVNVSGSIVLALIVPPLVRLLRPYYRREIIRSPPAEEAMSCSEEVELGASDRLDVHLAFVSCVIAAVFYLCAAASTTTQTLILSGISIGFTSIHTPTIRSLVAGTVDPLEQGEALAAIEMVCQASSTLSPIVMGSILTATINTTPLLSFYIHLVIVLISSTLLFLIRDADRYREPRHEV